MSRSRRPATAIIDLLPYALPAAAGLLGLLFAPAVDRWADRIDEWVDRHLERTKP